MKPPQVLSDVTAQSTRGVPLVDRPAFGRRIAAIGQSLPVAQMAEIAVDGARFATYHLCAMLAAICGPAFP